MNGLLAGLAGVSIALVVQRVFLRRHEKELKASRQAFAFHTLRDRLQEMAINGTIDPKSVTYEFLWAAVNSAIKHAGTLRLRDVLHVASQVDREAQERSKELFDEVQSQPEQIQDLFATVMKCLTQMVVRNDVLVMLGFRVGRGVSSLTGGLRALGEQLIRAVDGIGEHLVPKRTAAVKQARSFEQWRVRAARPE